MAAPVPARTLRRPDGGRDRGLIRRARRGAGTTKSLRWGIPLAALLVACGRLDALRTEPPLTPSEWCERRPCIPLGDVVLGEPLGTFLVFLLAALWIGVGVHFLRDHRAQRARTWLGVALALGGVGAALAGISYQAFGYDLKCAGRDLCLLTNGFEVGYSVTQALSASAMLTAVAFACTTGAARRGLIVYAGVNAAVYAIVAFAGVMRPSRTLLSFEVLMLFALPGILLVIGIAGHRYRRARAAMERSLLAAALGLLGVQAAYFGYAAAGFTQRLWEGGRGFYFSENDVLHIGMIGWLAYVFTRLGPQLRDASDGGA